jgi:hypothetical protein
MMECPFCHSKIAPQAQDLWFQCPRCGNWVRMQSSKDGKGWLEQGVRVNDRIIQIELMRQTPASAVRRSMPQKAVSPLAQYMTLEQVRVERGRLAKEQEAIELTIQRVIQMLGENVANAERRETLSNELYGYNGKQAEMRRYAQFLAEREQVLLKQPKKGLGRRAILTFVSATAVIATAVFAYTLITSSPRNITSVLSLVLLASGGGLLMAAFLEPRQ